ncbi:hypothetical protein V8C44DRAFT_150204 [Trichoderma aethiopicum]
MYPWSLYLLIPAHAVITEPPSLALSRPARAQEMPLYALHENNQAKSAKNREDSRHGFSVFSCRASQLLTHKHLPKRPAFQFTKVTLTNIQFRRLALTCFPSSVSSPPPSSSIRPGLSLHFRPCFNWFSSSVATLSICFKTLPF